MSSIGDIVVFDEVEYELLENNIIPQSKNNTFMIWMNVAAIGIFIGLLTITLVFGFQKPLSGEYNLFTMLIFIVSFIVFIIVHEMLHGLSFMMFGKVGYQNIQYGVVLKSGVAYCISLVPVRVWASRLSLMMPIYVVCLPLYVYSLFSQQFLLAILSLLFFTGSVGDIYYMWKLRKTNKDYYMFEEAPTAKGYKIGYLLFKKN